MCHNTSASNTSKQPLMKCAAPGDVHCHIIYCRLQAPCTGSAARLDGGRGVRGDDAANGRGYEHVAGDGQDIALVERAPCSTPPLAGQAGPCTCSARARVVCLAMLDALHDGRLMTCLSNLEQVMLSFPFTPEPMTARCLPLTRNLLR